MGIKIRYKDILEAEQFDPNCVGELEIWTNTFYVQEFSSYVTKYYIDKDLTQDIFPGDYVITEPSGRKRVLRKRDFDKFWEIVDDYR